MDTLKRRYYALLDNTDTRYLRYMHDQVDWEDRMVAIVGARGTGKTTLLLQHIKLSGEAATSLYVTADDMYFTSHKLLDLAEEFHRMGGQHLYVDEVHKYRDWSKEMKLIYDYLPRLKVVFTGSSVLDIFRGADDLSRRVLLYKMRGMSLREYLNLSRGLSLPVFGLQQVVQHEVTLRGAIEYPLSAFREYLQRGYYPFAQERNYEQRLLQTVNTTLETDIPMYARLNATAATKLKHLLTVIAESVPFKPNVSKIAAIIGVDRNTMTDYMEYMVKAGLLQSLQDDTGGIRALGKVAKIYLQNTNLAYVLSDGEPDRGNLRETFFMDQLSAVHDVRASAQSDFLVDGKYTFEVGGRKKGKAQIEGLDNAYIVKDDIEQAYDNVIPLWQFGFLY